MYLVYLLPLFLVVLIVLIFAGPVLALILAVLFMIGLGLYKFLGPGTEPEHEPPPDQAAAPGQQSTGTASGGSAEEDTGPWGETWPEKSR